MIGRQLPSTLRTLMRAPASSLLVVLILTVTTGASVAIFALADVALLKPLPYPDPDRLVTFTYTFDGRVAPRASEAKYVVWQEVSTAIEDATAVAFRSAELDTADGLRLVSTGAVSASFFRLFGVPFTAGRPFSEDEEDHDAGAAVVLSHHVWQQQFGQDPAVLGRRLMLDGRPRTIIGVVARGFDTSLLGDRPDLWIPLRIEAATMQHGPSLSAFGRLRLGVSLTQAWHDDRRAADEFRHRYPGVMVPSDVFAVQPFSEVALGDVRRPLGLLVLAVALLLALGCANVAGLLLVQMSTRHREMAVRMALGGSRRQIAQQLLSEALVLATIAGTLGLVLGLGGARALVTLAPNLIPRPPGGAASLALDGRLAAFLCLLTISTVVACLVLPTLMSTSVPPAEVLRGNGRTQRGGDQRGAAARSVIVATQVAIAAVLTIGAALLGSTWWALQTVDRGFNAQNVATLRTSLSSAREIRPDRVADTIQSGLERLLTIPGVVAVAATCCLPLESDWLTSLQIVGSRPVTRADELLSERRISPSYFDVLEIPMVRGRPFGTQDSSSAPRVAIVNQAMARRFWPGQDPIGEQVRLFPGQSPDERTVVRTIVGVVADVRDGLVMAEQPRPTVYVPLAQVADDAHDSSLAWIVRHHGASVFDHTKAARALQSAVGGRPVFDISSLEAIGTRAAADTTLRATLLGLFSAAALLLAAIGVYGAVSAAVRQRWHEMGVRLALGAQPARLRQRIVREALRVVMTGAAVGLLGALLGVRAVSAFLFGVSPRDPFVFLGVAVVLATLAALAAWVPANRVVRLNVVDVLHRD